MKKTFLRLLPKLIDWLQKRYNNLISIETENLPYTPLSPISTADINNDYGKALDWALKNRRNLDIKNIALTGPYGSGKSSIIKTYIRNSTDTDLQFLHISLATFKEEEEADQKTKSELLGLIELSILQQIFYHEEDNNIPDSRFRKIKIYTRKNLIVTTIAIILLSLSIIQLIFRKFLGNILELNFSEFTLMTIHYTSLIIATLVSSLLIYRSVRIINSIKINKLNFQNAEIEIDKGITKSILNHHLDEILYFFEVTKYNVVIIEDLDRFKQTEIFTKLREINLLINSSKKIKKEVVFIYAVRDDMFKDHTERTKFFDFIIPVIPIINPSNSSEKLLEKKSINKYQLSENLIDSLALFIDDMRLLHNVTNEFYLYRQKLNQTLNQDKLLAMIVYKNIFPSDFTLLTNNSGFLFDALNGKQKYIQAEITRLNTEIASIKDQIKSLEKLKLDSIRELNYLYVLFALSSIPDFSHFSLNGLTKNPLQMAEDENFDLLTKDAANYKPDY
ncbi:MAG: P-loop NTPase fold protein, partial [Chitinophagaceae bacterium]